MRCLWLATLLSTVLLPAAGFGAVVHLTINNYAFSLKTETVHLGDTVVWTNKDDVAHTVTALGNVFDSGVLNPGQSYRYVFYKSGTYPYRCAIHPEMRGTIIVEPDS